MEPLRIFLADEAPDVEAELLRLGHVVVGTSADRATAACAHLWPRETYMPHAHVQAHRPHAAIFVSPLRHVPLPDGGLQEWGYKKEQLVKCAGVRGCCNVGLTLPGEDPRVIVWFRRGMHPGCIATPHKFSVWATTDETTAVESARERRTALWRVGPGGLDGIVEAIRAHVARAGYSASRSAVPHRPGAMP